VASVIMLALVWDGAILIGEMGNWPAPFGITLVADGFAVVMVLITAVIAVAVSVYAIGDIDRRREAAGYHPLFQSLIAGVCGAFLTGDIFNLYVWFEVMLIASFALLILGGEKAQIDGAIKYVGLNLVSTVMFLTAVALLYGLTGTLNMADLHLKLKEVENQGLVTVIAVMFLVGFGIKAALFPMFFWLPASYHTPPAAISAVFSALLTKVGVYALIRSFTLIFTEDVGYTHTALLVIAWLTMIVGVFGAAAQNEFRRILSFHIISQIGYMILGLALYTTLGIIGAVFYLVHHIIVKANLFLVSGVANRLCGSYELKHIGGIYARDPLLAFLFLVPAFSLAGFPPLSGFWAKFILLRASLDIQDYVSAFVILLVGLMTIYSMTKIWLYAFWKPMPSPEEGGAPGGFRTLASADRLALVGPIAALATMTVLLGLYAEPFIAFSERAAAHLIDPESYVRAVLEARQ
jgi:multicomponent Na+:H+ antiporter subunit D